MHMVTNGGIQDPRSTQDPHQGWSRDVSYPTPIARRQTWCEPGLASLLGQIKLDSEPIKTERHVNTGGVALVQVVDSALHLLRQLVHLRRLVGALPLLVSRAAADQTRLILKLLRMNTTRRFCSASNRVVEDQLEAQPRQCSHTSWRSCSKLTTSRGL